MNFAKKRKEQTKVIIVYGAPASGKAHMLMNAQRRVM